VTVTEALEAMVAEHDRIGSPLRSRLGPGLPRARVEAALAPLGLTAPEELIELHAWHEIVDAPGDQSRVDWFWSGAPDRLDEAVREYRQSIEIGGVTPAELEEHVRRMTAASTFTGFWRTDWFPILYGSPETYAIECPPAGEPRAAGAIWRANWHPDDRFPTMRVAPSLTAALEGIVELLRLGAYAWDAEHGSLVPVDAVFERAGLADGLRPWPSLPD
jgi:hypothetical protein